MSRCARSIRKATKRRRRLLKKNFAETVRALIAAHALGLKIEIWFQDEARIGQQGTITYVWARKGSRPRLKQDKRFIWAYLFGAICPARGVGAGLVLPTVSVAAMNAHLAEISVNVAADAVAILLLDGAGWHVSKKLVVPENIILLPLPPYAPELNAVENIWQYIRSNFLAHQVWESYDAILNAGCDAWNKLIALPDVIRSIGGRAWAQVVI